MGEKYRVNLCTFMGRQYNVELLLRYVEEALRIGAIDHYWMIDMTRNHDDHEYIFSEQQRLDEIYPGRVHVVNREERRKELDAEVAKDTIGSWCPFYKFLTTFEDNDVIIKCDDDTLYFDVETIRAAAEFRWKNQDALLMHANTINNGITAYHQQKQDMWKFEGADILKRYPTSGLTGPLFSHPDIACECHKQFAADLIEDEANIDKYKLHTNPYFAARVSINMIFMLGKDREALSKIDTQDEYVSSSKLGQQLNRPNQVIGDFTCVHHTYGVQEPVMEEIGTHEIYIKLCESIFAEPKERVNKPITTDSGKIVTLNNDDVFLSRFWGNENSIALKHVESDKYMNIKWDRTERVKFVDNGTGEKEKIHLGIFWWKTELTDSDKPLIFNTDLDNPSLIQIQDCTEVLKAEQPGFDNIRFMTFPVKYWFQQNYKKQLINARKQDDGTYMFESANHPGYFLHADVKPDKTLYFFKQEAEDKWLVEPYGHMNNKLVPIRLDRGDQETCENDPTTASVTNDDKLPECRNFREFYWMVDRYMWELIEQDDGMLIKLVADDLEDLYLNGSSGDLELNDKDTWIVDGRKIKHKQSGKYLNVSADQIGLSDPGVELL